jgi:gluconolactonase
MSYRRALPRILAPVLLACFAAPARSQTYGTVALDASLADASAQVTGVLNKNLEGGSLGYCEGPSSDGEGSIFFTEGTPNRIWKVTPSGQASIFGSGDNQGSNGTEFDPQGRLIVGQKGAVAAYTKEGTRSVLQATDNSISVNDLTIGSTGAMYYSHWGANVFFRSATGQVTQIPGFQTANGVEWIEERNKLYVAQDGPDQVWVYDVASDGKLSNGKVFVAVKEPDGITADEKGNVYVASWEEGKVFVFDTTGKSLGSITVTGSSTAQGTTGGPGGNSSNCIIGANKKLYITGDGGLYSVQLKVGPRLRPGSVGLRQGLLRVDPSSLRLSSGAFNPVTQSLAIALPVAGGRFQVRIYDARMREVWSAAAGDAGLEWNGRNAFGDILPSGRYLIMAQSVGRKALAAPVDLVRR